MSAMFLVSDGIKRIAVGYVQSYSAKKKRRIRHIFPSFLNNETASMTLNTVSCCKLYVLNAARSV